MLLTNLVKTAYDAVARTPDCVCTTACDNSDIAKDAGYSSSELSVIPAEANLGLSCGNPLAIENLTEGEYVIDLGSGAGFDSFLAAFKVKDAGKVIGIDFSKHMIRRARSIAAERKIANVTFIHADIEKLPLETATFDIAISNCVLNLILNKADVYREIYRVLKPGGRISVADIALLQPLPQDVSNLIEGTSSCMVSTVTVNQYREILTACGFENIAITAKSVGLCFNSDSPDPFGASLGKAFQTAALSPDDYLASIHIEATTK